MTPDELLKQANAALAGAKATSEGAMLQPKIDAIIAGTENKKAGTANLESIRKRRDALAPGEVLKQARDIALKESQVKLNDAKVSKVDADIKKGQMMVQNSWRNVTSMIEARLKEKAVTGQVTPTIRYRAYNDELKQIRQKRKELEKAQREYQSGLTMDSGTYKNYYQSALDDVEKLIKDLDNAESIALGKRGEADGSAEPLAVPGPPSVGGPITPRAPGVTVMPINGKGRGGKVPAKGEKAKGKVTNKKGVTFEFEQE
jgi:hypothetical protein